MSDPPGDVRVQTLLTPPAQPLPSSAATDAYDIRALLVTETPLEVNLELRLADLGGIKSAFPATVADFRITFESSSGVSYHLNTFGPNQVDFNTGDGFVHFCIKNGKCSSEVRAKWDIAGDSVRIGLAKRLFLGRSADGSVLSEEANSKPFGAGSGLKNWKVVVKESSAMGSPAFVDELQADTLFPLELGVPNQDLVLRRTAITRVPPSDDEPNPFRPYPDRVPLAVTIGKPTPLVLVVENLATTKRLVNLTAAFSDPQMESKFRLRMPQAIEVPAGQSRNLTVIIDASERLTRRESAAVVFSAQTPGEGSIGAQMVTLVATHGIGPKSAKLLVHAANPPAPAGRSCTPADSCYRTVFWLNSDDQDLAATADQRAELHPFVGTFSSGRMTTFNIVTDTPLGQRIWFESGKNINAKIAFSAGAEFTAKITLAVSIVPFSCVRNCQDEAAIGAATIERIINPTQAPLEFTIPVDARIQTVGHDKFLRLSIEISSTDPRHTATMLGLALHPAQSNIVLPLIEDLSGQDYGSLRFYVDEAKEFVNPGRTRLFNVRLANEGSETDTVEVRLNASEGWAAHLQPATRFLLQPGESVGLGAFLTAPVDAKEATVGNLTLNATSALVPPTWSQLRLRAIVTSGVDIADQAAPFQADEDTQKRVALHSSKESPGVSTIGILFVALGVGWIRRRR